MAKTLPFVKNYGDVFEREVNRVVNRGGDKEAVYKAEQRLFSNVLSHGNSCARRISSPGDRRHFLRGLRDWEFAGKSLAYLRRYGRISRLGVFSVYNISLRNANELIARAIEFKISDKYRRALERERGELATGLSQLRKGKPGGQELVDSVASDLRRLPMETFQIRVAIKGVPKSVIGELGGLWKIHKENMALLRQAARTARATRNLSKR